MPADAMLSREHPHQFCGSRRRCTAPVQLGTRTDDELKREPAKLPPFWRDGQSSVLLCSESALKRPHIFVPALLTFLRQPALEPSSGQVQYVTTGLFLGILGRFSSSLSRGIRVAWITNVDQREVFSGFHSPLQFVNGDSRSVSHRKPPEWTLIIDARRPV